MNYVIPQQLAQAILDYLVAHPYREVMHLVVAMQQLQPVPVTPENAAALDLPGPKPAKSNGAANHPVA